MKKDNFQPIVMPCTEEQYESLVPVLEKNNITYDKYQGSFNGIVNDFTGNNNCVGKITNFNNTYHHISRNRKYYQRFNRKIFLKSLGIVEEPEFVLPKKWCVQITPENYYTISEYRAKVHYYSLTVSKEGYMRSDGCIAKMRNSANLIEYKEITFEQFQKYVLKQKSNLGLFEPSRLDINNVQSYDILESKSVTNKQTKMKSTVNEIIQPGEKLNFGMLVVHQERICIINKYVSDNNFDLVILHPSSQHGKNVINVSRNNIRIFKGKLTLEQ